MTDVQTICLTVAGCVAIGGFFAACIAAVRAPAEERRPRIEPPLWTSRTTTTTRRADQEDQ